MNIIEYLSFVTGKVAEASVANRRDEVSRMLRLLSAECIRTADTIDEVQMPNCNYPNCRAKAMWTPLIKLPTLRTAGDSKAMVPTKRPTLLLFVPVCQEHRDTYSLIDWIHPGDWTAMQDAARENGCYIPDPMLIAIEFKPLDWTPSKDHLELERGN